MYSNATCVCSSTASTDYDAQLQIRKFIPNSHWFVRTVCRESETNSRQVPRNVQPCKLPKRHHPAVLESDESKSAVRRLLQMMAQATPQVNLSNVVTPEVLEQLVVQPGVAQRLVEFLPRGLQTTVRRSATLCLQECFQCWPCHASM
jgi:hypothetical protein